MGIDHSSEQPTFFGIDGTAGKVCRKCKAFKPFDKFRLVKSYGTRRAGKRPATGRKRRDSYCKACRAQMQMPYWRNTQERLATDPEFREKIRRERRAKLLKVYGLTPNEYAALLAKQGGVCAICRRPERWRGRKGALAGVQPLVADHDHKTGKVRGLLCHTCNVGLGNFGDAPDLLRTAIAYLESTSGRLLGWAL